MCIPPGSTKALFTSKAEEIGSCLASIYVGVISKWHDTTTTKGSTDDEINANWVYNEVKFTAIIITTTPWFCNWQHNSNEQYR